MVILLFQMAADWTVENGSDARTSLGLGTISTQGSDNVTITGGSVNGYY